MSYGGPPIFTPSYFDPQNNGNGNGGNQHNPHPHLQGGGGDIHGMYQAVSTTNNGITTMNTGIGGVFTDSIFSAFAPTATDPIMMGSGGNTGGNSMAIGGRKASDSTQSVRSGGSGSGGGSGGGYGGGGGDAFGGQPGGMNNNQRGVGGGGGGGYPQLPPGTPSSPGDGIFACLSRPDQGREGRPIYLRANHFKIKLPNIDIFHYDITITPEKCPRRVNREVIDNMFRMNQKTFHTGHKPVYDGRKNLYSKTPLVNNFDGPLELDVTLPSDENRERVFKVVLQFVSKVSLGLLDQVLERKSQHPPPESIQALDVIMRHFPSINYTPVGRSFFSPPKD
ncbi:protein argonaute-2-like, partial [Convolutriloba macropyga]|uniref:protein argonaute-2-like n=1 Tax=Convolutriloba macropyga TaxID=536237 RepID=UPI003F51BA02